jgi:Beta-propeller repeat/Abnormal spindle-like microcephaly-assoc'd, ASPM-SPD-2-Hydin
MRKFLLSVSLALCLAGCLLGVHYHALQYGRNAGLRKAAPISAAHASVQYGKLPLAFEPNLGQSNGQAKYLAHGDGYSLFLASDEAVLVLGRSSKNKSGLHAQSNVLRMQLVGANQAALFSAIDELPGKANYFLGRNPDGWHTDVPTYRKIAERGIYPGVDLVYYGTQRQLEYDFVVAPDADVAPIRLEIQGGQNLRIDSQGQLVVATSGGNVLLRKPVAYQNAGAEKQMVAADYALDGNNEVRFEIGAYDRNRPLIIDPILAYSTYLGGTNIDGANAIAVASDNTAFVTGGTFSTDFPTAHPLQPNHGGPDDAYRDAFVTKFSADGSTLLYSTYLGGGSEDVGNGIAVDNAGDAYIVGTTESDDFPVPSTAQSFNPLCGGDGKCGASYNPSGFIVPNGFVVKLNPAGSAILYSGFVGNYEYVYGQAIAVDANQLAYVTGKVSPNIAPTVTITPPNTPPPPFPITANAAQTAFGGADYDAFVAVINPTGDSFLYSTYLGAGEDEAYGIAVDKNEDAYVTGLTSAAGFPVTAGAYQSTYGGAGDAFFSEINTNASGAAGLVYSTFLGGTGLDQGNGIAVDSRPTSCTVLTPSGTACNAYIAGGTGSSGLGASAMQANCALDSKSPPQCEGDAFVAEFNPNLSGASSRVFFTYLGGSLADTATGIALDQTANMYITGSTVSTNFPVCATPLPAACSATAGPAFQATYGGGNDDAFVAKIDATTLTLDYSSYLGGTDTDNAYGIAVDTSGSAYVAGQTCSTNFPVSNPEQITPGGDCDAFVSKVTILNGIQLNPSALVFPAQSLGTTSAPEIVTITNGDNAVTGFTVGNSTGPNSGEFAQTTNCPSTLAPGVQCTVTVTFTPTSSGVGTASIQLSYTALGSPQIQSINLTGTTSSLTLSASSLSFGSVPVGTTSAPQTLTATNQGSTALTFTSITASGDFAETDNCTKAPIQPTTGCTINVTYSPTAAESSVGSLTLNDNAPGSPQVVLLNGSSTVQEFSISAVSPTATVPAGKSALYTLSITPIAGFSQPVSLSCSGLPSGANCSASQNPVTLSGTSATQVTLMISTAARTFLPPSPGIKVTPGAGNSERLLLLWLAAFIALFMLTTLRKFRHLRATFALAFVASVIVLTVACNGGTAKGNPPGTPAGNYQIVVTGTSGSASQSTTLNLQVN